MKQERRIGHASSGLNASGRMRTKSEQIEGIARCGQGRAPDTINKSNGEIGARNTIYAPVYLDLSSVKLRDIPSRCV